MQLIAPEVLSAARDLSTGAVSFLAIVGFLMWSAGWRWHRFWVVFGITLTSGLIGLSAGRAAGGQVMVVGVLLAVSAGMLALELARILSFLTGGTAAWMAAQAILPDAHELWAVFLSGGLVGVALYRFWTMLTTSLIGALICMHTGFTIAEQLGTPELVKWTADHAAALNGAVIVTTLLGVFLQTKTAPVEESAATETVEEEDLNHKMEREREREKVEAKKAKLLAALAALDPQSEHLPENHSAGWWTKMTGRAA